MDVISTWRRLNMARNETGIGMFTCTQLDMIKSIGNYGGI